MSIGARLGAYPGRGLLVHSRAGEEIGWIYFVTGRSHRSRQRSLSSTDNALVIGPTVGDPSDELRHYICARPAAGQLVVGNGDHVDAIVDGLRRGDSPDAIVGGLDPEPDPPILTPRLAVIMDNGVTLVSVHQHDQETIRRWMDLELNPDTAVVVTTYDGDRQRPRGTAPIHSFGETRGLTAILDDLWSSLQPELRVLAVAGRGPSIADVVTRSWQSSR